MAIGLVSGNLQTAYGEGYVTRAQSTTRTEIYSSEQKLKTAQKDAFLSTLKAAAEKNETTTVARKSSVEEVSSKDLSTERKFLGVTSYAANCIHEQAAVAYEALESTPENPIVQVTLGADGEPKTYNVYINEVDLENASDMEVFAYLSYFESVGMTLDDAISNWTAYTMAKLASDLDDYADGFESPRDRFMLKKMNAIAIVEDAYNKMQDLHSRESERQAELFEKLSQLFENTQKIVELNKLYLSGEDVGEEYNA